MVFVTRQDTPKAGFSIGIALNRKVTKGEVGLEVEVEGNKFPKPPGTEGSHQPYPMVNMPYWSYVHDGSLRGKDNAEYVLRTPVAFSAVPDALKELWDGLTAFGSKLDDSNRTSVHVHLNCQPFHFNRLTSFLALYFTLEEILTEFCGDHRVGNLFCLRAKDAPAIISQIKKFIKTDGGYELSNNAHHYAGLNAAALHKFGSVEIRTLRGVTDPTPIIEWVSILERLYRLSADLHDPRDVCSMFSAEGPMTWFDNVLGDKAALVRRGCSFSEEQFRDSLYDGIRMAQDLCYCRDWSMMKPMDVKPDPFDRDSRKVLKALSQGANGDMINMALEAMGGQPMPQTAMNIQMTADNQWTEAQQTQWVETPMPAGNPFTINTIFTNNPEPDDEPEPDFYDDEEEE